MKNLNEATPVLKAIIARLAKALEPEQIWLFGSHAWGLPDVASDVDVLVVVSEHNENPVQLAARAYRALRGISVPVDVIVKTCAEVERYRHVRASLVYKVLNEGIRGYG